MTSKERLEASWVTYCDLSLLYEFHLVSKINFLVLIVPYSVFLKHFSENITNLLFSEGRAWIAEQKYRARSGKIVQGGRSGCWMEDAPPSEFSWASPNTLRWRLQGLSAHFKYLEENRPRNSYTPIHFPLRHFRLPLHAHDNQFYLESIFDLVQLLWIFRIENFDI